MGLKAKN